MEFNNKEYFKRGIKTGILGGGQLGKMLLQAGAPLEVIFSVLDPSADCACVPYCPHFQQGNFGNAQTVFEFGKDLEVVTIEIENISLAGLAELESKGVAVKPSTQLLQIAADKGEQKLLFQRLGLPSSEFALLDGVNALNNVRHLFPAVQKLRKAGYDGKGVKVLETFAEAQAHAFELPTVLEKKVEIQKEIAVIVARNAQAEIVVYDAVEMVFHGSANMLDYLIAPADLPSILHVQAQNYAKQLAEALQLEGVLAVEMFINERGQLLINELAPRPHNSGHHTIYACATSQYEQHLRGILNFPLGATEQFFPVGILNIVGAPDYIGAPIYHGIDEALRCPNVKVYLYGKNETRPYRKMGHLTIWGKSRAEVIDTIQYLKQFVYVTA